jgi:hypothetical protein
VIATVWKGASFSRAARYLFAPGEIGDHELHRPAVRWNYTRQDLNALIERLATHDAPPLPAAA